MTDSFESVFSPDIIDPLYQLCGKYDLDPEMNIDSERYFLNIINTIDYDDVKDLMLQLEPKILKDFVCLNEQPEWIQNPDWQFNEGKPMIFIGQLSKGYNNLGISCDMVFYIFYDPDDGTVKTVIQTD